MYLYFVHLYIHQSGQIIIFHQPRFPWNKGISLPWLPCGVRSYEVAIIWPDQCTVINVQIYNSKWWIQRPSVHRSLGPRLRPWWILVTMSSQEEIKDLRSLMHFGESLRITSGEQNNKNNIPTLQKKMLVDWSKPDSEPTRFCQTLQMNSLIWGRTQSKHPKPWNSCCKGTGELTNQIVLTGSLKPHVSGHCRCLLKRPLYIYEQHLLGEEDKGVSLKP